MLGVVSGSADGRADGASAERHAPAGSRLVVMLALVFLAALAGLGTVADGSLVPVLLPAAGVAGGLYLTTRRELRPLVLGATFVLVVLAHLLRSDDLGVTVGLSLTCAASVWVLRVVLVRGREGGRIALLDQGDVSRLVGGIAGASLAAALGCAITAQVAGSGGALLSGVAGFGAYAAAYMVMLPLFLRTLEFEPLAGPGERVVQSLILLGTTVLVFWAADAPPVIFAVMPMFAWYAFRGSIREATALLMLVAAVGTALTLAGLGPIHGMMTRYDLSPELVHGVLQLFVLDCGLILLPLSVMTTQQRMSAGRADSEGAALRQILSATTGAAIVGTGRDGRIEVFNPAAERMFGWPASEMIGQLADQLVPEAELFERAAEVAAPLATFDSIVRASIERGDQSRLWSFVRADGQHRIMRVSFGALTDELGEARGHLAIASDVTEREEAHLALESSLEQQRRAMDQLRELERVKSDFVATVSHELRTPITNILGYLEVLGDGMMGALSEPQQGVVSRVDRNGQRLLQLVQDLLTLSQIEAAAMTIEPEDTDLVEVVRSARDEVDATLGRRDLSLQLVLPTRPALIQGDAAQLQRMVVNLLGNAVKFTPQGGAVTVSLEQCQVGWVLVVDDTGLGIPEDEQAQLFNRFFRSRVAMERAIQGVGLGLTIVQSIITLHGGEIAVRSEQDRGTTVTVTLPHHLAPQAASELVPA